jgi:hypothetical protein
VSASIPAWLCLAVLVLLSGPVKSCRAGNLSTAWDATLYAHGTALDLRGDSVLNPGNALARLPGHTSVAEARFNLKAETDSLRLTLRPLLIARSHPAGGQPGQEAYISQGQLRWRLGEAWSLAAGREVLNWGPAQFRSPSSPFYFDNGRSTPLAELSGVDDVKLSWTPDTDHSLALAYLVGDGHDGHDTRDLQGSGVLYGEQRGEDWAAGLALVKTPGQGLFAGLHGRYTYSDALLFYAEAASSTRADALVSPSDASQPFRLEARSPRRSTLLLGTAYTLENGQTLNLEWLHDGHGYTARQMDAYFDRAAASPALAGLALGYAPPLLGRDFLHLVWQSNLMDSDGYWRLMLTHSLTDQDTELAGYGEYALNDRASLFGQAALNLGSARQSLSGLYRSSLTIGLKLALP